MMPITDAVKHLLLINILMFFGTEMLMGTDKYVLALFYPESEFFKPWQIVTHLFMHANLSHLMFNMLSLFFIGPLMEKTLGTQRFLSYYFLCGFGGAFLHTAIKWYLIHFLGDYQEAGIPALGASGAIFGLFIGLAYFYPNLEMYLMFIPIPVKAKYIAIVLIAVDLFLGVGGFKTGVAHFGHLGGALFGFLMLYKFYRPR